MKSAVLLALFLATHAHAGNEVGNGGDRYGQEFTAIARSIVSDLKANPDERIHNLAALESAVENATVRTRDTVRLAGEEVDAVNFPDRTRIELSRSRWKDYDFDQKRQLVMHEILGLAREEDQHYQISGNYTAEDNSGANSDGHSLPTGNASVASQSEIQPMPTRYFLGLGGGISNFTGNMGKLYGAASPSLSAKIGLRASPTTDLLVILEKSSFDFAATQTGSVTVGLTDLKLGVRQKLASGQKLEPYVAANLKNNFREQTYTSLGQIQKDTAFGFEAGIGCLLNFSKTTAIWLEGTAGSTFFKDRFDETFATDGIANTTGSLLAANIGVQMAF